jgi:hypothetical protein
MTIDEDDKAFIEPYSNYIAERTGTNPRWARLLSLIALSVAIDPKITFDTKVGSLHPNIFGYNNGASRLTRKSISTNNFLEETLKVYETALQEKVLGPSNFTSEGLHKFYFDGEVEIREDKFVNIAKATVIVEDEFGRVLKEVRGKRYMSDALEFRSQLYDGHIRSRCTKKDGYLPELKVQISYATGSTPPTLASLSKEFFTQGLGNRFLYVNSGSGTVRKIGKEFFELSKVDEKESIIYYAYKLLQYHKHTEGRYVRCDDESKEILARYTEQELQEARKAYEKDAFDIQYSYTSQKAEYVYKVAMLKACDRCGFKDYDRKDKKAAEITIVKEDVYYAIKVVEEHYEEYLSILNLWKRMGVAERKEVRRLDLDDVKQIIEESDGIVTSTVFTRKAQSRGFKTEQFENLLQQLFESGEVLKGIKQGELGRPTMYYLLKETPKPEWFIQDMTYPTAHEEEVTV